MSCEVTQECELSQWYLSGCPLIQSIRCIAILLYAPFPLYSRITTNRGHNKGKVLRPIPKILRFLTNLGN